MLDIEDMLKKINEFEDNENIIIGEEVFTYSEEYSDHSKEIKASLISNNYSFHRTGFKQISYERWIDTDWTDWE